jgi:hypothetical protein
LGDHGRYGTCRLVDLERREVGLGDLRKTGWTRFLCIIIPFCYLVEGHLVTL